MRLETKGAAIGMQQENQVRSKVKEGLDEPRDWAWVVPVLVSMDKVHAVGWVGVRTRTEAFRGPSSTFRGLTWGNLCWRYKFDSLFSSPTPGWEGGPVVGASLCKTSISLFSPIPALSLLSPPHYHVGGN